MNGFIATDGEVVSIVRRLDSDGDNKVTLEDFIEAVRYTGPIAPRVPVPSGSAVFEESKRASSPLRTTAASPLRQTESVPVLAASARGEQPREPIAASPSRTATLPPYYPLPRPYEYSSPSRRFSPLKLSDENELVRAFKEQIALENELEDAKNRLALQSDFNLPDAFDLLDRRVLGSLSSADLLDALSFNGVYAVPDDVFLFVKRYDRNIDGRLNFSEFSEAFLPKAAAAAASLKLRRDHYSLLRLNRLDYFTSYTRELFFKTLRVHFSVEASAENLRRRLLRLPGFNTSDAFAAVDADRDGYITRDEFRSILREYGFFVSETELLWLVDRYDRDYDGRISYREFVEEITPKSPSRI